MIRMTHGKPPCGAGVLFFLARAGRNFAINSDGSTANRAVHARIERVTRRTLFLLLLPLAACRRPEEMPADLFPEKAAGGWQRLTAGDVSVSDAPDPVPRTEITKLREATYQGPGKLDARVYQLSSPDVGLTLAQRWRPSADTVFFNQRQYFVVVKWDSADRGALRAFLAQLEARLGPEKNK